MNPSAELLHEDDTAHVNSGHASTWMTPPIPRQRDEVERGPHENLNLQKVPLSVLMWNVRGINAAKKQQYLDWLIRE